MVLGVEATIGHPSCHPERSEGSTVPIVPNTRTIRANMADIDPHVHQKGTKCTFLILVDSDWSLSLKKVDSGLTLLLV